jgi:hypothetical protein
MRPASPPRGAVVVKADQAWRGRTLLACGMFAAGVIGLGAANLDWSEGLAMALGQLAGMVAPMAVLGAAIWGAAAWAGRKP